MEHIPTEFIFELSAKGEKIDFHEAEGISTKVTLPRNLQKGDHPFKFRLPSFPKSGKLVLKNGSNQGNTKLVEWFKSNQEADSGKEKDRVSLTLKSKTGHPYIEWTLHNAHPVHMKAKEMAIEDLELNFSFYTFIKR